MFLDFGQGHIILFCLLFLQKKPKFLGKEHSVAEGSKFGIGTESLFFEKVILYKIAMLPVVDKFFVHLSDRQ